MDKGPTANNRVDPVIRVDLIIPGDRTIQAELMRLADLAILAAPAILVIPAAPAILVALVIAEVLAVPVAPEVVVKKGRKLSIGDRFGLSIMRARAAQLGGDLIINSQPGSGTTVTLTWPKTITTEPLASAEPAIAFAGRPLPAVKLRD